MPKSVDHRLIKIIDEILVFIYSLNPTDVDMKLHRDPAYSELTFEAKILKPLEKARELRIDRLLSCPRRRELEENYWELTGNDTTPSSELALVGMMTDDYELRYDEEHMLLFVKLIRNI